MACRTAWLSNDLLRHASTPLNRGFLGTIIAISGTSATLSVFCRLSLHLKLFFWTGSTQVSGFAPYPGQTVPLLKHFLHAGRVESHTSRLRRQAQHCIGGPLVIASAIGHSMEWKIIESWCQQEGACHNSLWLGYVVAVQQVRPHIAAYDTMNLPRQQHIHQNLNHGEYTFFAVLIDHRFTHKSTGPQVINGPPPSNALFKCKSVHKTSQQT